MFGKVKYAVVALWQESGSKILADYFADGGEILPIITMETIDRTQSLENDRISIDRGQFTVHMLIGELHYACVTEKAESPSAAGRLEKSSQIFLERLKSVYRELPLLTVLSDDITNQTVIDLSEPLKKIVEEYNRQEFDVIPFFEREIAEIRQALVDGVEKIIDRGERLDELLRKAESLEITPRVKFHVTSRTPRKKKAILLATCAAVIMFISVSFCVFLIYFGIR